MNIKYSTGFKLLCLLMLTLVMVNCERAAESEPASDQLAIDSLESRFSMPGWDIAHTDSLVNELIPLLLSPPESRILEDWYAISEKWTSRFGDAASVLACAEIAFEDFKNRGELSKAAQVKNAIGRLYTQNGEYPKALEAQQLAYEFGQRADDLVMVGWSLIYRASPYVQMEDLPTAEDYSQQALALGKQINHPALEAVAITNLGTIEGFRNNLDNALRLLRESLVITEKHGFSSIEAINQLNISYLFIAGGQYDQAIEFLQSQLGEESLPVSGANSILYLNLYEAYAGKRSFDKAEEYLDLGCAMAEELNFGYGEISCADLRVDLHEKQGQYQQALSSYKSYHEIYKEQTGLKAAQEIRSLETEARLNIKDLEIEQLHEAKMLSEDVFKRRRDLFILAIGVLIAGLLAIYLSMRNRHRAKSSEQQRVIAETKLQVLQSQMNPHFIFNALGGIQNYILKSEKIEAYNYLGKFAALLRMIANNSANVHIELEEEIMFIRTYLDLEKLRFRKGFDYQLEIEDGLLNNNHNIPSMMIQPVVENAIIHGLSGLDRPGELKVEILSCPQRKGITCIVTDNGRGRTAAARLKKASKENEHLSIASVNIEQRLQFLQSIGFGTAEVTIEDLQDKGQASGTQVRIRIPFMDTQEFI